MNACILLWLVRSFALRQILWRLSIESFLLEHEASTLGSPVRALLVWKVKDAIENE